MAISILISQHVILLQGALQKQNMATNKLGSGRLRAAMWSCSASSSDSEDPEQSSSTMPPKLEPFSQSRISRLTPERSLLRKAEAALSGKKSFWEGNLSYTLLIIILAMAFSSIEEEGIAVTKQKCILQYSRRNGNHKI
jgi:hypothetical protein